MIVCQVTSLCIVLILDYLIFLASFTVENLNGDIMAAFAVVLPLAAIAIAVHIPRIYYEEYCAEKELSLLKQSVKDNGKPTLAKTVSKSDKSERVIRYAILCIAALLVVLGIFNDGVTDVLQKAVKICTECIGLG
jgi:hypothetical protein